MKQPKEVQEQPEVRKPRPLNRDVAKLRRRMARLATLKKEKIGDAVCDIIDLKGLALAVLIRELPALPKSLQKLVAEKIEDFLFFHPHRGRKLMSRLVAALQTCVPEARPSLVAAIADVASRAGEKVLIKSDINRFAAAMLETDIDLVRKSKAVEVLGAGEATSAVPLLVKNLLMAVNRIDAFENYQFTETVLFALKRLAGEGFLRLMIDRQSAKGLSQFKLEWRHRSHEEMVAALKSLEGLDEGFPQLVLKVIDLSEFSFPFLAMIKEGLQHQDKWIRQAATASIARIANKEGLTQISHMLRDPAQEVRMMAISSLGNFPISLAGSILTNISRQESESLELRLNALYALYSQKNLPALRELAEVMTGIAALNAKGLSALLMPADEGLTYLMDLMNEVKVPEMVELFHYIMELARPEDLKVLATRYSSINGEERRSVFVDFLAGFMTSKAGPILEQALSEVSPSERKALKALQVPIEPVEK